ncbi:hypothetical protein POM88_028650 [Heracleum sosnowskyi]|uniref:Uncharacterized protein n=1 Tax=Heracleum sosnowskyi TaxID=360622 RepID=A0AAD8HS74_9APIA|nr:hypothetical protein POM88_028650 [Heracleum sosnowskyi]
MDDLINKTVSLSVDDEEEWECQDNIVEEMKSFALVGRVLSNRSCNSRFLKTVFGRKWEAKVGWDVKVLGVDAKFMDMERSQAERGGLLGMYDQLSSKSSHIG